MLNNKNLKKEVCIILLNWNNWQDTEQCLHSLLAIKGISFDVVVVDNASTNDSVNRLSVAFPEVHLIKMGRNEGFTGGNNAGLRWAIAKGYDYFLLLNNDTLVNNDFLGKMIEEAVKDRSVGIVSPKIYFYENGDKKGKLWSAGGRLNRLLAYTKMRGYGNTDQGQYDQPREISFASGCAMLIRRELIEKIGLLDEDFFFCLEDVEFSYRANNAGYRIVYSPRAIIWHKESSSAEGLNRPFYVYFQVRNRLLLASKMSRFNLMAFIYIFLFALPKRALTLAVRGKTDSLKAMLTGIIDYFRGKMGRGSSIKLGLK